MDSLVVLHIHILGIKDNQDNYLEFKRGASLSFSCIMVGMKKIFFVYILLLTIFLPTVIYAQEEDLYKGVVLSSSEVPCSDVFDDGYTCFEYVVNIPELNEEMSTIPLLSETQSPKFKQGDKVYISSLTDEYGDVQWSITGYNRNLSILFLVGVFSMLAVVIGRRQGLGSLISLAFTVFILYVWAIPKILNGGDVLFIGITTVTITLIVIMYASHGINTKSTIAIFSTLIGIFLVAILAKIFSNSVKVDGLGSEEAFILLSQTNGTVNLSDVFFVSILIGAMGVLDDVVMSQISAIQEIYKTNSNLSTIELYKKAMNIGRDHISSMVNTLFIAYAGSSLAVVMLLTYSSGGIGNIIQIDVIAEEIVRTVTSSIGILLVVPISSIIAAKLIPLTISKKV